MLGLLAEAVGDAPLGKLLQDRIFEPLDLDQTSFTPGRLNDEHVHGHRPPSHQGVVTGPPLDTSDEAAWWAWGAGGIVSTAEDVQQFFVALLRGRLIEPAGLREMEPFVQAGRQRYGLGLARPPAGARGDIRGTSRARSRWPGTRVTRPVSSCSS